MDRALRVSEVDAPDRDLDEGALGNDGLTDAERQEYADSYARGPGRGMDERTRRTIAKMHQRRNPPAVCE